MGDLVASGYNKPDGLGLFLAQEGLVAARAPRRIVFTDDNSDNVVGMFMKFAAVVTPAAGAAAQAAQAPGGAGSAGGDAATAEGGAAAGAGGAAEGSGGGAGPVVTSVWFEPPPQGKPESCDLSLLEFVKRFSSAAQA
jgi:hypothetical protein